MPTSWAILHQLHQFSKHKAVLSDTGQGDRRLIHSWSDEVVCEDDNLEAFDNAKAATVIVLY
jgi:hypothetical protein